MSQAVKPVRGSTEQPDHIMLSIKGDAATSMTVTWRTCTDIKEGYVLYLSLIHISEPTRP